jgi:hypothetical protein
MAEHAGRELSLEETLEKADAESRFLYVRVVLEGGGAAWSSPAFRSRS